MVLISGNSRLAGGLTAKLSHRYLADGIMLLPLQHRRQGVDLGLQQGQLLELFCQFGQQGFQFTHLLAQGGFGGKGLHGSTLGHVGGEQPGVHHKMTV